jgi:ABC-type multidrug transport system fused ATPase/permease subunit
VLLNGPTLGLDTLIRYGIFFPPLAGVINGIFELIRTAPRIHTLGPALDARREPTGTHQRRPPPAMPCEIRFESVSFAYDGVPVLTDVSFVWKPGEVLGIRGPNGSGKSTLLKLILGLLKPTAGKIFVGGVDLGEIDLPAWRRGIAYLPQRCYLPEDCTVFEAMQLTVPEITDAKAREALELMSTWEQLDHRTNGGPAPLKTLVATRSAGVRQRIMLARTLGHPTAFTILDEPDENLDTKTREALAQLARQRGSGQGIIVATHDPTLLAIADVHLDLAHRSG